jgi:membrane-associated protease RseP (regulator of RpoE activity)
MAQPTLPGGRVACMINVDMIGRMRNDRIEVYGTRSARGLRRLVSESNSLTGLALDFTWEMKENSDHYSFFSHRIPTLMLHTGLHADYHRPSDDSHQLNSSGMEQAARFLFALAYELATRPAMASFRQESYGEHPGHRDVFERLLPESQPRLGVSWLRETGTPAGLVIQSVAHRSAAERAGLRVGDRIVEFGGLPVTDVSRFRLEILAAAQPVPMRLQRAGEPEPVTVQLALSGSPTRIGIAWKDDEAEPGTVMLTHVVYGSAADQAGLAGRDRIYAVAGRPFKNSSELHQLLTSLPGPIELLVERDGRLRTVSLEVLPPRAQ